MTQEEKQLLLKDLCARLPYGVKVELHKNVCTLLGYVDDFVMLTANVPTGQQTNICNIKPYLRPMSSMTDDEKKTLNNILEYQYCSDDSCMCEASDWLNENHFDFRHLIEKGLALEAPEDMYKIRE